MEEDDDLIPAEPTPARRTQFLEISYRAPLPPPQMLRAYEEIVPGSAERIINRVERESDHRHYIERTKLEAEVRAQKRGQWFAFLIALLGIGGGFGLIWIGKSAIGLSVFVATLASLVSVFVYGRNRQDTFLEKQLHLFKELAKDLRRPYPPEPEGEGDE